MFWVVVYSLTGASLLANSITFTFGNMPTTFSSVLTYAGFGFFMFYLAGNAYMDEQQKGLNDKYVKMFLDVYKRKFPFSFTVEEYVKYLKHGAIDGWLKADGKGFEAIMWMSDNIDKCEEYVKRSES